jgi:hypothetical protein
MCRVLLTRASTVNASLSLPDASYAGGHQLPYLSFLGATYLAAIANISAAVFTISSADSPR